MGLFASTCVVSGLPVEEDDPVRALLLCECPYIEGRTGSTQWVPRTYPLRATYNGYGSLKNVQEGPERDIWLDGLKLDAIPRGWGRNTVHDVPIHKDMSFDELLTALLENRLRVRRNVPDVRMSDLQLSFEKLERLSQERGLVFPTKPKITRSKLPPSVPTRVRVERLLQKDGFPIYGKGRDGGGTLPSDGYTVTKTCRGVLVRWQGWTQWRNPPTTNPLERVLSTIQTRYAAMDTVHGILIAQKPEPGRPTQKLQAKHTSGLKVELAFIREDVWNKLSNLDGRPSMQPPGIDFGFVLGLGTHEYLLKKRCPKPPESFLQTASEMMHLMALLSHTRFAWTPSASHQGPQIGDWNKHARVLQALLNIAKENKA